MAKEIKQQIEITKWQAVDGTIFDDKQQCITYDNSALGVLRGRLFEKMKRIEDKFSICSDFSDDYDYYLLKAKDDATCDLINQVNMHLGSSYLKDIKNHLFVVGVSTYDDNIYFVDMTKQQNALAELSKDL